MSTNSHTPNESLEPADKNPEVLPEISAFGSAQGNPVYKLGASLRWREIPLQLAAEIDALPEHYTLRMTLMTHTKTLNSYDVHPGNIYQDAQHILDGLDEYQQASEHPSGLHTDNITAQFRTQCVDSPVDTKQLAARIASLAFSADFTQMQKLIHYDFVIPVSRGFSQAHLDAHYPGLLWNQVDTLLSNADVRIRPYSAPRGGGSSMPTVRPSLKTLNFSGQNDWVAQWRDGWVTASAPLV